MSAYFVAGVGTGIGKTFTTCALLHADKSARGYKPIVSGYGTGDCDTTHIMNATGAKLDEVSPWRFKAPLSPDMAAAKEGRVLKLNEIVGWTKEVVTGPCYIETVGGLMVPLNDTCTTRDWMQAVNLPIILVTGSYLGALSHTLCTLEAARAANLSVAALVINESCDGVDLMDTKKSLSQHVRDIPLIVAQPRVASPQDATIIHGLAGQLSCKRS